jgi:hypothetical protein
MWTPNCFSSGYADSTFAVPWWRHGLSHRVIRLPRCWRERHRPAVLMAPRRKGRTRSPPSIEDRKEATIMRLAVSNIGTIVSGDWREPFVQGDTIVTSGPQIEYIGSASAKQVEACDVMIDADGATAIPGLIDSHVHITFGDYTPRQQTVGYLESYVHGGVTTAISASEVHVPGRPRDAEGGQGARRSGAQMLRRLSAGRHDGSCRLRHSRSEPHRKRSRRDRQERCLARQGRVRRAIVRAAGIAPAK